MSDTPPVVALHGGADLRAEALREALVALIYERAAGMPIPTIIGVLEIVKHGLLAGETA